MLFHSQPFILGFLPACLAGCFMLRRFAGQNWALAWLLAASLFFYGWLIANLPYL
jgi:alginate O-acetyltransferase complex protein AlgI